MIYGDENLVKKQKFSVCKNHIFYYVQSNFRLYLTQGISLLRSNNNLVSLKSKYMKHILMVFELLSLSCIIDPIQALICLKINW